MDWLSKIRSNIAGKMQVDDLAEMTLHPWSECCISNSHEMNWSSPARWGRKGLELPGSTPDLIPHT
jgi:hypothetical protein